jgi:hypothetical protein
MFEIYMPRIHTLCSLGDEIGRAVHKQYTSNDTQIQAASMNSHRQGISGSVAMFRSSIS